MDATRKAPLEDAHGCDMPRDSFEIYSDLSFSCYKIAGWIKWRGSQQHDEADESVKKRLES